MKIHVLCMALLALLGSACHRAADNKMQNSQTAEVELSAISKSYKGVAATDSAAGSPDPQVFQSGQPAAIDWDKKIIKTANLKIELKDYTAFNSSLHQGVKAYGAYIAGENQTSTDVRTENDVTIKVPVDQFENILNSFSGDGIKILEKTISTEDVTGEVVDTKSRMEAKKQVRDRYLELLKQAKNMKDILAVQEEINTIQEEIESAGGRVNYLTHQSAYSTIHVNYFQYPDGITHKDTEPSFFSRIASAFTSGAGVVADLLLFVIHLWPFVLLGLGLLFYFKKWRLKKL